MITARGEVKLFDFGIVKGEGRVSKTDVGVVKGNVSFMSPEQARGQTVDARSDLFSLGLVLYYGLTGEQLYPGQSTFDQLMRAATGPKTEQLKLFAELPPVVERGDRARARGRSGRCATRRRPSSARRSRRTSRAARRRRPS